MLINPIQPYTPRFRGNNRAVCDKSSNLLYKTTTYFFRDDLNWDRFAYLLKNKYQSAKQVNIINHVCSNGQEPYSLAIKLIQKLGAEADKFFPIKARDINYENIESARRGRLGIKNNDIYRINSYTNNNIDLFFDKGKAANPNNDLVLIPKKEIKNKVVFNQADIFDDIETLPPQNTVLLCRNFWPYIDNRRGESLAQKLSRKLDKTCLIVIGDVDYRTSTPQLLKSNGFIETYVNNVFSKD